MDEAEFANWLHNAQEEYWSEGMQMLLSRGGQETVTVPPPPEPHLQEGTPCLSRRFGQGRRIPRKSQFRLTAPGAPVRPRSGDGMSADERRASGVELITMMADMVMCQSCCRNPGMYQCDYCGQINCTECTADDPERVACRSPCQITESRPAKRLHNAPEVAHSASMVAAPESRRELVSEEPQDGRLPKASGTRKGRTPTGGEQIPLVPLLQE